MIKNEFTMNRKLIFFPRLLLSFKMFFLALKGFGQMGCDLASRVPRQSYGLWSNDGRSSHTY